MYGIWEAFDQTMSSQHLKDTYYYTRNSVEEEWRHCPTPPPSAHTLYKALIDDDDSNCNMDYISVDIVHEK